MSRLRIAVLILATAGSFGCRESCGGRGLSRIVGYYNTRVNREDSLRHSLRVMRRAIHDYHEDKQRWPTSLEDMVREKYLTAIPHDAVTGRRNTWILIRQGNALLDVRSGAKGSGCDGLTYRDW
jgi:general secretion pathway protein G